MFNDATILVTGGTGSWGVELIRQLLTLHPQKIIIFSRNENSQVELKRQLIDERLLFFIGDIRDKEALMTATANVDYIFHLAALKHVPVCEDNPLEAIKTNVMGTQYIINAAIENNVKKVIYVSTDKAADPVNTYGMTKALGEKLMVHASSQSSNTQFVCIRGGNVLGSSGSVLPLFQKQIAELEEVHITDNQMVRYFISPEDAIKRLLKAAQIAKNGDILVMNMDAFRIIDLAEVLIEQSGKEHVKLIEIGIRPGEKIEEVLIADGEKSSTYLIDDELFVITQHKHIDDYTPLVDDITRPLLTKNEIKNLLKKANFI